MNRRPTRLARLAAVLVALLLGAGPTAEAACAWVAPVGEMSHEAMGHGGMDDMAPASPTEVPPCHEDPADAPPVNEAPMPMDCASACCLHDAPALDVRAPAPTVETAPAVLVLTSVAPEPAPTPPVVAASPPPPPKRRYAEIQRLLI